MAQTYLATFFNSFLGKSPRWYKFAIISFLIVNPIIFYINPFIAGWILIVEFIFTLALALQCYPLPSGGLLALEAIIIGMTSPAVVYHEIANNLPVILLLMFMVAGIYFMKEGLLALFTKILVSIRSKVVLSLIFCFMGAFLSAFLDALTVTAVIITVAYGFYFIFYQYAATTPGATPCASNDSLKKDLHSDMDEFRGFLRNLMMHGAVGTALGGATTLVGEPQNLLIGKIMHWEFGDFFHNCAAISIPVLIAGLILCVVLEITKSFGYGYQLPTSVRTVLEDKVKHDEATRTKDQTIRLIIQALVGVGIILALAMHLAEVGLIGLAVILILSALNGKTDEHDFAPAFHDGMPFTALLVVFFSIVAVIHDQHLFEPIISHVLTLDGTTQLVALFSANGLLSMISDNVFVATVYITEIAKAFDAGLFSADWYSKLAVVVNMGTNIPSVATPNGQAAFLFLLTSALAPMIKLSYVEMLKLALPYTIVMTCTALFATCYFL